MTEEMPDQNAPDQNAVASERHKARKLRRRRRRWVFHFSFWPTLGVLGLGLALVLASMAATGRAVPLPQWVANKVEARLNREFPTGAIGLGRVEFGVSPEGAPRFSLVDLSIKDETGLEIARIFRVQTGVNMGAALRGRFQPARLYLTGAEVTLRRRVDGTLDLAFGQKTGASGDLAGVLDAIDAVFSKPPMAQMDLVEMDALTITLEDARSGRLWQVTDGRLKLTQTDKIVDITVNFDVFNQTEELAVVELGFRTDKLSPAASISASFKNAVAADIAAQSPLLAFLGVLDAPISGALRSSIDASGAVSELAGTLELGPGALSPTAGARPVRFETAKVYIDYDPGDQRLNFPSINTRSELGEVLGQGYLYLNDFNNGWPSTLLGQFQIESATIRAGELFENTVEIEGGAADFRLHLNPFTLDLGQVVLVQDGTSFTVNGQIAATSGGWSLALDGTAEALEKAQALALWPLKLAPKARTWVAENVTGGRIVGMNASVRLTPGTERRVLVEAGFSDFNARVIKAMAPLQAGRGYMVIRDDSFMAVSEGGFVRAPDGGGKVDIAGTVFTIPDMPTKPTPARVDVQVSGPLKALLSLLAAKPFDVFKTTAFGPDLATGHVRGSGEVALILRPNLRPEDVDFAFDAVVEQVRSAVLVPGKVLTAAHARVEVDNRHIEITGAVRIGAASGTGSWFAAIGPAADGTSRLEAVIDLNQAMLDTFNIGLPDGSVSGQGTGQFTLDFTRGQRPAFRLTSDLNRLGLSIPEIGWEKARNRTGKLLVAGHLDNPVSVERLEFDAPGLVANGVVTLKPDGGFDEAVFERVRLLNWLDAPVTIAGRGAGAPVAISVRGGTADMSRASFGAAPNGAADRDAQAPVDIQLDRLKITTGIDLTDFSATLDRSGGLHGTFTARVNGGPRINGVVAPQAAGTAFRIKSNDAGGVLKAAGVFQSTRGGDMTLILAPHAGEGVYDGQLDIERIRTTSAPALLELLGAISVVGLLEQVQEEGILFQKVEARFRMTPSKVTITKGSAIGASIGISMDGTYTLGVGQMDLAGVLSPIYIINSIGRVFTRKGEGLLGFTYTLTGTPDDPKVDVNPLSIFTPAMFRELFRRPPPKLPQ